MDKKIIKSVEPPPYHSLKIVVPGYETGLLAVYPLFTIQNGWSSWAGRVIMTCCHLSGVCLFHFIFHIFSRTNKELMWDGKPDSKQCSLCLFTLNLAAFLVGSFGFNTVTDFEPCASSLQHHYFDIFRASMLLIHTTVNKKCNNTIIYLTLKITKNEIIVQAPVMPVNAAECHDVSLYIMWVSVEIAAICVCGCRSALSVLLLKCLMFVLCLQLELPTPPL